MAQDAVTRPALLVSVSGLFRICWSTSKRESSCSCWACKRLIWKSVLIRILPLFGARWADKCAHISKKTWCPLWKGDISACAERQSRCSWLSSIYDFYCVMFENEYFVFEAKQTETHSRPILKYKRQSKKEKRGCRDNGGRGGVRELPLAILNIFWRCWPRLTQVWTRFYEKKSCSDCVDGTKWQRALVGGIVRRHVSQCF